VGYALQVFVSSTCYELRDLRAAIVDWLTDRGVVPMMSDEIGFPHYDRMPPYASCLRVLEQCPLVIVVIDRQYGNSFSDWGPYPQYAGCAPTHAELRHALNSGKRVLIFVQDDIWKFYEVWRKTPAAFTTGAPRGLDEATLQMIHELKHRDIVPWMASFTNVADVLKSLQGEFINQLYTQFRDLEKQATDQATFLLERILAEDPEVRDKITSQLAQPLAAERDALQLQLAAAESKHLASFGQTNDQIEKLIREKQDIQARLDTVTDQLTHNRLSVAVQAMVGVFATSSVGAVHANTSVALTSVSANGIAGDLSVAETYLGKDDQPTKGF